MRQKTVILVMAMTVVLSGISGFAGTYLANELNGNTPREIIQSPLAVDSNDPYTLIRLTHQEYRKEVLSIPEIAQRCADSVVEIVTETVSTMARMGQFISHGAGSGVIINSSGYIVTNNHVISGADRITVRLRNGESYTSTLIGRDARTDIAVLKIEAPDLTAATIGDSSKLITGELAVAIGNPLGQLGGTVTEGIISALDRDIEIDGESMKLLQTSAAINPGNSGGGLFNAYGELIGIVNAKSSGSGIEGLGFAIPINTVKTITDQLISHGYVTGRADLSIVMLDITNMTTAIWYRVSQTGVYVQRVLIENGLQPGDRIVSINGTLISSSRGVRSIIDSLSVGDQVQIIVERSRQTLSLVVTLREAGPDK